MQRRIVSKRCINIEKKKGCEVAVTSPRIPKQHTTQQNTATPFVSTTSRFPTFGIFFTAPSRTEPAEPPGWGY